MLLLIQHLNLKIFPMLKSVVLAVHVKELELYITKCTLKMMQMKLYLLTKFLK